MKHLTILIIAFFFCQFLFAQDTIYKRNKTILIGKISEINLDDIKYKPAGQENGPTIAIDKDDVWKIVFQNGTTQTFFLMMEDPAHYADNRKNAIKIDFMAPMFYKTVFSYERSIKPGMSFETTLGIIGLGYNPNDYRTSTGAFLRFGVKLIKSPDYYLRGMRYAHILKGGYIKPEIMVGTFSDEHHGYDYYYTYPYTSSPTIVKKTVTNVGIHINFGKQWVYSNSFLLDIYGGIGYGFDNQSSDYYEPNGYTFIKESPDSPFSFGGGLKIGFLFN